MLTLRGVGVCSVMLAMCAIASGADLPEKLQKDIDKALSDCEGSYKSAEKKLLKAFDTELELIRKHPRLKADAKQEAIEALWAERESFEKNGVIPFSPRMRAAALAHLKTTREAVRPVAAAYDKAIEHLTKAKDDAAAAAVAADKKKVLKPKVVGVWACTGVNFKAAFTWVLYADGSVGSNKSTWALDKDKLVITNRSPEAPPGGWVDVCVVDSNGQTFVARNKGAVYKGRRVDPP
jgi:hypothetical protein